MKRAAVLAVATGSLLTATVAVSGPSFASTTPIRPTGLTINMSSDAPDAKLRDGKCDSNLTTTGKQCSVRAAVMEADSWGPGPNINFKIPGGTYTLSIKGSGEDGAATGDLDLLTDITLNGAGATLTAAAGFGDRRVDVPSGSSTIKLYGLKLQNGAAPAGADGGAVRFLGTGTFSIASNPTFANNSAGGSGGALYVGSGTFSIAKVTLTGNQAGSNGGAIDVEGSATASLQWVTATNNHAANGGGLSAFANPGSTGTLTVMGSTFNSNSATQNGGGLDVAGTSATLTTINGNTAANGGGVQLRGGAGAPNSLDSRMLVGGNTATANGGGIYATACGVTCGTVAATSIGWHAPYVSPPDSTGNSAGQAGAGVYADGALDILRATIGGNTITGAGPGGAIYHTGTAPLRLTNDTVANNAGGSAPGGVVVAATATDPITNVTIGDNTGTGANAVALTGAGVPPTVVNTVLAASGTSCDPGAVTSLGHNLDSGTSCGLSSPGDLVSMDPVLNPLKDAGGGTNTMPPGNTHGDPSPVIGHGDTSACPAMDQRYVTRPQSGTCDIGAYESSSYTRNSAVSVTVSSPSSVSPGSTVTFTFTLTNNGAQTTVNTMLQANLPAGLTFQSCSANSSGVCGGTGQHRTVSWPTLATPGTVTATIVAQAGSGSASAASGGVLVSSDNPDTYQVDNTTSLSIQIG